MQTCTRWRSRLCRSTNEPTEQDSEAVAEVGEGRAQLEENIAESRMLLTLSRNRMSQ
jgi:hypothetical protein